jgi:hypothetical protein
MLNDWPRNPFMLLNDQHQETMHEGLVEMPLAMLDPTGTAQVYVATKSVVTRIINFFKWLID